jgi:NADH:ubiquinone oxidoreductase subunit E
MTDNNEIDLSLMDPIFEQYRGLRGNLIPILQKTQATYDWLPREALQLIADELNMALSKVHGVATFYSQFYLERRGRHVVQLCDGTACHVKGAPSLIRAIEEEYGIGPGETTDDYELTMEVVYCLGSCALAPAIVLDGQVMGRMRQDRLLRELANRVDLSQTLSEAETREEVELEQ